jgi:hypothetical protein
MTVFIFDVLVLLRKDKAKIGESVKNGKFLLPVIIDPWLLLKERAGRRASSSLHISERH